MSAKGKRVLLIGGETPVGRAVTVGLAEAGADIAIASLISDTQAEFAINSALNELWAIGRKGLALAIDAADDAQLTGAVQQAEAEIGAVDVVVAIVSEFDAERIGATFAGRAFLAVDPQADAVAALKEVLESFA